MVALLYFLCAYVTISFYKSDAVVYLKQGFLSSYITSVCTEFWFAFVFDEWS